MSMPASWLGEIPEETVRAIRSAFPKGSRAIRLRDALGPIYHNDAFAHLYPVTGQPGYAPWRLALVTVLQYADHLTDRQAAEAVHARLDWKYCLGLSVGDPGFDFSLLSEFRTRLVNGQAETLLLDLFLDLCHTHGWLNPGGLQRTDSTHVLARVRSLSNLECVGETMRAALNELADVAPDWLLQQVSPDWFERYNHRVENYRLPKEKAQRIELAQQIGEDGERLLHALDASSTPRGLSQLKRVGVLRKVWQQYYEWVDGHPQWVDGPQVEQGEGIIRSPYDPEAQTGKKRETVWLGYKVHLTETCEHTEEAKTYPHLIVDVQTTVAPVNDWEMTAPIEQHLREHELTPGIHLMDMGYVTAEHLLQTQKQGIQLVGPVMPDTTWQAKEGKGFDLAHFQVDWQAKEATCPQGQKSHRWREEGEDIRIHFATPVCAQCPVRTDCTRAKSNGRSLRLQHQEARQILQARRQEQETASFREQYTQRSGIEATISQAVRGIGIRRARYDGRSKVHLQHVCTAVAINFARLDAFLMRTPPGKTRVSPFERLGRALPHAQTAPERSN